MADGGGGVEVAAEVAVLEGEVGGDEDLVVRAVDGGWRSRRRFRGRRICCVPGKERRICSMRASSPNGLGF